ncbi:proline--tRNA ligase, partial [bacterium]|nr:proline--tRNA ligase [bacterium]
VQPKELWEESGRWAAYGGELMRLKDRHGREMCLGPTHEEIITSIARDALKSYKQLPVNLYQIQSKFRDERRPRFGLLRGREFIMKDAYSFAATQEDLEKEYQNMWQAYTNIFNRCGLETKAVQSDSGAIGGNVSHEFMVITDTDAGENDVFYCDSCDYAANSNHAISNLPEAVIDGSKYFNKCEVVSTPNCHTIEQLAEFLKIPATLILKSLVYIVDKKPVIALIRADKTAEETKLLNAVGGLEIRIATSEEIAELMQNHGFNAVPGFIGPKGMKDVPIIVDNTVKDMKNFVVGINETDVHMVGANLEDLELGDIKYTDIRLVEAGEFCPQCGKPLKVTRGIEVGNIFQLGTKYSKPMNAVFLDADGKANPYIMGCYGIGVTRTAAAAVEAHHDEWGIKWPLAIAPYHAVVVPVSENDEQQVSVANKIYEELKSKGIEVVIDDRAERPGVKFKDADLIGFPYRVTVGKTITEGNVEFVTRATGEKEVLKPEEAVSKIVEAVRNIK